MNWTPGFLKAIRFLKDVGLSGAGFTPPVIREDDECLYYYDEESRWCSIPKAMAGTAFIYVDPDPLNGDTQGRVYEYIVAYKEKNDGLSPTYRQIAEDCALATPSAVAHHIDALIERGLIEKGPGRSGLIVCGGRWSLP